MKKIALIMLAVVSMAMVSCGGSGVKPADPAITYEETSSEHQTCIKDCLKVISVSLRENSLYETSVSAKVELVNEPSEPIKWVKSGCEILDKNEAIIARASDWKCYAADLSKKGDVGTISFKVETKEGLYASKVVEDARFVRLTSAWGRNMKE